jgi:hypothetical protein
MPNQDGVPTLSDLINNAVKSGDEANKNQTALAHLILGDQLGQKTTDRNLQTAQDVVDKYSGRGKKVGATIGKDGSVSLSENEPSLISQALGRSKAEGSAVQHVVDIYQHGLPEIIKQQQALKEGLDTINDPKQVGSLGQARSLAIRSTGMTRFNEHEGNQMVPATASQKVAEIFNYAGDGSSPLNDAQRAALNQVFMNGLKQTKDRHDMLKKNALNSYQVSPFFDATRADQLNNTIGSPFEESYKQSMDTYKNLPTTNYAPGTPAPPQAGLGSKIKDYFSALLTKGAPQAQAAPAQMPQQPQSPLAPQPQGQPQKSVVKTEISPSTGQKRITYSDGSQEIK